MSKVRGRERFYESLIVLEGVTVLTPVVDNSATFSFEVKHEEEILKIFVGAYYRHLIPNVTSLVNKKADLTILPYEWKIGDKSGVKNCLYAIGPSDE